MNTQEHARQFYDYPKNNVNMSETTEADQTVSPSVRNTAEELADIGLLTEKQAIAYVLRRVERVPRVEAADRMGISPNTLDTKLSNAKKKIESARETLELIDSL